MDIKNVIYKGTIKGKFMGFKNVSTKFELSDGQIWRQNENLFLHRYAFNPEVQIFFKENKYYMQVHGIDEIVEVKKIK